MPVLKRSDGFRVATCPATSTYTSGREANGFAATMSSAETIQFVILGSMMMGASSLTAHGFEYVQSIDVETLAPAIGRLEKIEAMWERRIHQWQREGAFGNSAVNICPGVMVWLVSIVATDLDDRENLATILGQVADRLSSHAPHAEIRFDDRSFDARAIASAIVGALHNAFPISHTRQAANCGRTRTPATCSPPPAKI